MVTSLASYMLQNEHGKILAGLMADGGDNKNPIPSLSCVLLLQD